MGNDNRQRKQNRKREALSRQRRNAKRNLGLARAGGSEKATSFVISVLLRARGSVWPVIASVSRKGGGCRDGGLCLARAGWPNGMVMGRPSLLALASYRYIESPCTCEKANVSLFPALTE